VIITQILILFFLLGGCSLLKEQSSSEEETFLEKDAMKQKEDHGHLLKKSLILDVNKFELDNGLTVLLMKNSHLPIFSYYTFIGVGSRFEDKGLSGATHFLEHLMFMGAKKYGPGVFSRLIEGNGGASNAFTNYDYTVYYESLPIKALETVVDLEADRLVNLNIGSQDFEDERKVILEERKLRFENSARGKLFLQVMQYMFKGTPYGESVIGKIEDIKSVSRDDINNYFKKYYAPNSALVVIVGDIDVDETIGLIKKYYGPLAKSEEVMALRERKNLPKLFKKTIPQGKYVAMNGKTENPMFYFSYQGVEQGTRKAYVFDLLAAILSAGNSSYFVQKYVIGDRPLLGHIGAFHMELKYDGIFMVGGELLKGVGIEQFRQIFTFS